MNISLVDYFEKVQHYLDCAAYEKEYEFPFLFEKEAKFREVVASCIDKFDEEETDVSPTCNDMCQHLNVANFSPVFEGNHTFISKASNYYENLAKEAVEKAISKKKDEFNEVAKVTKEADRKVLNKGISEITRKKEKTRLLKAAADKIAAEKKKIADEKKRIAAEKKRIADEKKRKAAEAEKARKAAAAARRRRQQYLARRRRRQYLARRRRQQYLARRRRNRLARIRRNRRKRRRKRKRRRRLSGRELGLWGSLKKSVFNKKLNLGNSRMKKFKKGGNLRQKLNTWGSSLHSKAKKALKNIKKKRRSLKKKLHNHYRLNRQLLLKHLPNSTINKLRLLEAAAAKDPKGAKVDPKADPKKAAEATVPPPPPPLPEIPVDPAHVELLKKTLEIYNEIKFLFDKKSKGVVKTADIPLDVDTFTKAFLYSQGIDLIGYSKMINMEISKTDLLAVLEGNKLGDALENRIIQVMEALSLEFKVNLAKDLDSNFSFSLAQPQTSIHELAYAAAPEHLDPDECFEEGCQDNIPLPEPTEAADGAAKPAAEGAKGAEGAAKKPETAAKTPEKPNEEKIARRLLKQARFDELEGIFDFHGGAKKKQILF